MFFEKLNEVSQSKKISQFMDFSVVLEWYEKNKVKIAETLGKDPNIFPTTEEILKYTKGLNKDIINPQSHGFQEVSGIKGFRSFKELDKLLIHDILHFMYNIQKKEFMKSLTNLEFSESELVEEIEVLAIEESFMKYMNIPYPDMDFINQNINQLASYLVVGIMKNEPERFLNIVLKKEDPYLEVYGKKYPVKGTAYQNLFDNIKIPKDLKSFNNTIEDDDNDSALKNVDAENELEFRKTLLDIWRQVLFVTKYREDRANFPNVETKLRKDIYGFVVTYKNQSKMIKSINELLKDKDYKLNYNRGLFWFDSKNEFLLYGEKDMSFGQTIRDMSRDFNLGGDLLNKIKEIANEHLNKELIFNDSKYDKKSTKEIIDMILKNDVGIRFMRRLFRKNDLLVNATHHKTKEDREKINYLKGKNDPISKRNDDFSKRKPLKTKNSTNYFNDFLTPNTSYISLSKNLLTDNAKQLKSILDELKDYMVKNVSMIKKESKIKKKLDRYLNEKIYDLFRSSKYSLKPISISCFINQIDKKITFRIYNIRIKYNYTDYDNSQKIESDLNKQKTKVNFLTLLNNLKTKNPKFFRYITTKLAINLDDVFIKNLDNNFLNDWMKNIKNTLLWSKKISKILEEEFFTKKGIMTKEETANLLKSKNLGYNEINSDNEGFITINYSL